MSGRLNMTQFEFAALLREAFLEVASKAWEAREIGISEERMLMVIGPAVEPIVQSILRKVEGVR